MSTALPPRAGGRTPITANGRELLELARAAALAGGQLLLRGLAGPHAVAEKSSPRDVVTELDRAAEALIVDRLLTCRPDDAVLGEESGERPGTSGVRWVIDPLDGTANYLRSLPAFVVSVLAEVDGEALVGVVHDPSRGETFTAVRGHGAACNGRPLRVSETGDLRDALVGTGFSRDTTVRARQAALLGSLVNRVRDIRHSGSAALDLCWVAAGRLDVYYEADLRYWDRAAGVLIAREAGAWVGGMDDGPPGDEMVIAGPPGLARALRTVLAGLARDESVPAPRQQVGRDVDLDPTAAFGG
ncbi:MAG TPA: inositol monophosphatase family protein [Micromonosporaceae bacterium]